MNLPSISLKIKRLASLEMPVEALKALLRDLAVELDTEEARLSKDRARKFHGKSKEVPGNIHGNSEETPVSRVEDNTLPSFTSGKEVKEESKTPHNPPTSSKPLSLEPEGFVEFMEVYPRRDHSFDRKRTLAGYLPALKRASHETIMEGLHHYAQAMIERGQVGTAFVALPRTWLNQDRWTIRYSTPTKGPIKNGYVMRDSVEQACDYIDRREQESRENGGQDDTRLLPRLRQGPA